MIIPLLHNYRKDTDRVLMLLIREKDERAFDEFFRRYARQIQFFLPPDRRKGGGCV